MRRVKLTDLLAAVLAILATQSGALAQAQTVGVGAGTTTTNPPVVFNPNPPYNQIQTANGDVLTVPYPLVQTDVTGIGGSLGRAQNLLWQLLGLDRNTIPNNYGVRVARDPRYNFTGIWSPIEYGEARVAMIGPNGERTFAAIVPRIDPTSGRRTLADRIDAAATPGDLDATIAPNTPLVMPTCDADYSMLPGNEIQLAKGAVLVKVSDNQPVYVSSFVGGNDVSVRLDRGAYVMVSAMDGRFSVFNLTSNARDAVNMYVGDRARCTNGAVTVREGMLAELYPSGCTVGANELVAYTVPNTIPMTNGLTLEVMRFSYPRAFKRFNLTRTLSKCDIHRVLKTAAAVSFIDREREWNGFALPAP